MSIAWLTLRLRDVSATLVKTGNEELTKNVIDITYL